MLAHVYCCGLITNEESGMTGEAQNHNLTPEQMQLGIKLEGIFILPALPSSSMFLGHQAAHRRLKV